MPEALNFHFEGALADSHRMNFYESSRFQYAAARLIVKLAQFRQYGRFVKKITSSSNFNIQLVSQTGGSFNINIESPNQNEADEVFTRMSLTELVAYVGERIVEKIDEGTLVNVTPLRRDRLSTGEDRATESAAALNGIVEDLLAGGISADKLPEQVRDLVKRRAAEVYREKRLVEARNAVARIDFARSQKLISMSAPLISEMATALRSSADTLEVTSIVNGQNNSVLYLNKQMAKDIETAIVDQDITLILGDITQFNKDNGWGKLKIENGAKVLSFSIPSDILPIMKQTLIDNMKRDLVYLETYFVRDPSGEAIRLIAVGILPTPTT